MKAGPPMPLTKLLVFGSLRVGTPAMVAAPSVAIDLPLEILVREDDQGKVWVSINSPRDLTDRHGLAPEFAAPFATVETLAAAASAR